MTNTKIRTFKSATFSVIIENDMFYCNSGGIQFSINKSNLDLDKLFDPSFMENMDDDDEKTVNLFIFNKEQNTFMLVLVIEKSKLTEFKHFMTHTTE